MTQSGFWIEDHFSNQSNNGNDFWVLTFPAWCKNLYKLPTRNTSQSENGSQGGGGQGIEGGRDTQENKYRGGWNTQHTRKNKIYQIKCYRFSMFFDDLAHPNLFINVHPRWAIFMTKHSVRIGLTNKNLPCSIGCFNFSSIFTIKNNNRVSTQ